MIVRCKQGLHLGGKKEELQYSTVGENLDLSDADAGFADASRLDFTLKNDSPVFKKLPGFKAIPFEKIGLYRDDYRAEVPVRGLATKTTGQGAFDSNMDVQRSNKK
ncbi:MAG: hypothetical protein NTW87_24610 [Planctomycetota bacterium]|nr:hypothetical protein [Planctomycetota bacterium]